MQYREGRRGEDWQASPKGSNAAQARRTAPLSAAAGALLRGGTDAGFLLRDGAAGLAGGALDRVAMGNLAVKSTRRFKRRSVWRRVPGRWFEQFHPGDVIPHAQQVPIRQEDNVAFCRLTHNVQPLHLDAAAARAAGFPDVLVNGLYTFATAVGVSVDDTTAGTLIANLGYADVQHPKPVFPGDTLSFETQVVDKRPSSKPGRGIVTLQHRVHNQHGDEVCRFQRTVLVRSQGAT